MAAARRPQGCLLRVRRSVELVGVIPWRSECWSATAAATAAAPSPLPALPGPWTVKGGHSVFSAGPSLGSGRDKCRREYLHKTPAKAHAPPARQTRELTCVSGG